MTGGFDAYVPKKLKKSTINISNAPPTPKNISKVTIRLKNQNT